MSLDSDCFSGRSYSFQMVFKEFVTGGSMWDLRTHVGVLSGPIPKFKKRIMSYQFIILLFRPEVISSGQGNIVMMAERLTEEKWPSENFCCFLGNRT